MIQSHILQQKSGTANEWRTQKKNHPYKSNRDLGRKFTFYILFLKISYKLILHEYTVQYDQYF